MTSKDVTSERTARLSNGGIAPFRVGDHGGGEWRSVTAFCHTDIPVTRYFGHGGDDAMHIFDYIAIGVLIACMLAAGAMVLHRAR